VVEVTVREGEPLEKALRRFKKKSFYEKPSDSKRIARKKAVRRMARLRRIAQY